MKKLILLIIFLVILIAIPLTVFLVRQRQEIRQRAAPATTLSFEPATITKGANEEFDLLVKADPGTNQIIAARLEIAFDTQYLEAVSISAGPDLPQVDEAGAVDNTAGRATIGLLSFTPLFVNEVGTIASIKFRTKAVAVSSTLVSFTDNNEAGSLAPEDNLDNVIISKTSAQVTIAIAGGASPTPGPSATPGASASPGSASPSPSASSSTGLQTTKITTPASGASVTTARPSFSGTTFPNSFVKITVNTNPLTEGEVTSNAQGAWTFTPNQNLANGTYTVTVTATNAANATQTEVITSTLTVNSSTGGTAIASSSPSPSSSTNTTPAASGTSQTVPTTGSGTPTFFLTSIALLLVLMGSGAFIFLK